MNNTVMVTLKSDFAVSMQDVKETFNLKAGEIDEDFGVIPLSHPEDTDQIYVVTVTEEAAERMSRKLKLEYVETFANSKISQFTPK